MVEQMARKQSKYESLNRTELKTALLQAKSNSQLAPLETSSGLETEK